MFLNTSSFPATYFYGIHIFKWHLICLLLGSTIHVVYCTYARPGRRGYFFVAVSLATSLFFLFLFKFTEVWLIYITATSLKVQETESLRALCHTWDNTSVLYVFKVTRHCKTRG